jgi:hypothetical protein
VDDLIKRQYQTDLLRQKFGKLPDLEKLVVKIYTYSI